MSTMTLGTGSLHYQPVVNWEQLPDGWTFKEVAAVGVDASDNVFVFNRGEGGILPGQFNLPHNIATDKDDRVWVADRENHRVQVFDSNGKYLHEIPHLHRPRGIHLGADDRLYVGELGSTDWKARRNVGRQVSILDLNGNVLYRFGSELDGDGPGEFIAPHGVHIDSHGDIYVGEVTWTFLRYRNRPDADQIPPLRVLQKFARVD